jgi:hypothetical protein
MTLGCATNAAFVAIENKKLCALNAAFVAIENKSRSMLKTQILYVLCNHRLDAS